MSRAMNEATGIDSRVGVVPGRTSASGARIPLWLKLAVSAFVAVLVPVYWVHYGPGNFVYFCDLALLMTLAGLWLESALLISMPAVGILAPQVLWLADFGGNLAGIHLTGMTDYMVDASKPLYLRGLSLFHGWLPILLVYAVARLGYDRRALAGWTVVAWVAMAVSYLFLPAPSLDAAGAVANVNYVYGMSDTAPQTWMPGWAWLTLLYVGLPLLMFWPTHLLLKRVCAEVGC